VPKLIRNNDVTNCFKKIINIENFKINSKFSYRTVYLIILLLLILTIFSLIIATILIL
jgi:hypothetical protein